MAFHNVSLPDDIQYGSVFGFGFSTLVHPTASGHEFRVGRQAQPRHRYRPIKELQSSEEAMEIKEFAIGRRGALHSWRIKDWQDYTSNADGHTAPTMLDQVLGSGDGTTTQFRLVKKYDESGPEPYIRPITLPVVGSVLVSVAGVSAAFTLGADGWVTLGSAPALGEVVAAGFEFDVPVRFDAKVDEFLALRADAYQTWGADVLEVIEVLDETEWPELWPAGGCKEWGAVSSDISLVPLDGELHTINQTTSINAFLPAPDELPDGYRVFVVTVLATATGTVQLRDDDGNTVGTALAAGTTRNIGLYTSSGTKRWLVY